MMNTVDQIKQYAPCVYGRNDWVEVRALKDGSAKKLWYPAHALSSHVAELEALNRDGWNIYTGVNPRRAEGLSGDDNVALCRALCVDFDHIEASDGLSPSEIVLTDIDSKGLPVPTLVVFSGHGVHCYWRLTEPIRPDQWRTFQERLNAHLGSDPTIKNPERIMRLPGFKNVKGDPVDCFIVYANRDLVYPLAEIETHLPEGSEPVKPTSRPSVQQKPDGYAEHKGRALLYASKWDTCTEGERNAAAYRHSAQMLRDFELPEDDAWEIVAEWNDRNDPPLDEKELRNAFDDGRKYGKRPVGSKLVEVKTRQRPVLPNTAAGPDPASELEALIEDEISGRCVNVEWPWPILTELGQCLTSGTRTMIVGGIGGSKSFFLLQAASLWVEAGRKVALLELERKRDFHTKRLLAQRTGIASLTKPRWVSENAEYARALAAEHRGYINRVGAVIHIAPHQFTTVQAGDWIEQRADEGCQLICIDPITVLARGREPWVEDDAFMARAEKAASESGAAIIFVTHAKKGANDLPDMDSLAGSAAWARFADSILWLQRHDDKSSTVRTCCGSYEIKHNRTLHLLKARGGEGTGCRLAYNFEPSLTLSESGIIVKQRNSQA